MSWNLLIVSNAGAAVGSGSQNPRRRWSRAPAAATRRPTRVPRGPKGKGDEKMPAKDNPLNITFGDLSPPLLLKRCADKSSLLGTGEKSGSN